MPDIITRGTTPTITLTVQEEVPEGAESFVSVTQDGSSFNPDVTFDHSTNSVSFTLSKAYTEAMMAGEYLHVQQTIIMPDGTVEEFEIHDILVEDMLYVEPEEPEEPYSEMFSYESEDTEVVEGTSYFENGYIAITPLEGSSPLNMGLYEEVEGVFELTQDNEFLDDKEYYIQQLIPVDPVGNENPSELGWFVVESTEDQADNSDEFELKADSGEPLYIPVITSSGDDPSEKEWLEVNELGEYVASSDTSVNSNKIYYEAVKEDYMDNTDAFYKDFDEVAYAAANDLECVDDVKPEEYQEYVYIPVVSSSGDNPSSNGWFYKNYVLAQETSPVTNRQYYKYEDYMYIPVSSSSGDNPKTNGWYYKIVSDDTIYVSAQETSPVENRQYYKYGKYEEWSVDSDSTGGLIPEEE